MAGQRKRFSFSQKLLLVTLFCAGFVAVLWHQNYFQSYLESWFRNRVVDRWIQEIQPSLPFEIESLEYEITWKDLLETRVPSVRLILKRKDWRATLYGPLTLHRKKESKDHLLVHFLPTWEIERNGKSIATLFSSFAVELNWKLQTLLNVTIQAQATDWKDENLLEEPLSAENLVLQATYNKESQEFHASFEIGSLMVGESFHSQETTLSAHSVVQFSPFRLGETSQLELGVRSIEWLRGDFYLDQDLKKYPLQLDIQWNKNPPLFPGQIGILWGPLDLKVTPLSEKISKGLQNYRLQWKTQKQDLKPWLDWGQSHDLSSALSRIPLKKGTLESRGEITVSWPPPKDERDIKGSMEVILRDLELEDPQGQWALRGIHSRLKADGNLSAPALDLQLEGGPFYLHQMQASLSSMRIIRSELGDWNFPDGFPLTSPSLPLKIGPVKHEKPHFQTSLEVGPVSLPHLARLNCIVKPIPEGNLRLHWPTLKLKSDAIDTQGDIRITTLGGEIKLWDFGAFRLFSPVPEVDFQASWEKLRLDRIGEWLHFGKMDGFLTGYAKEVVFQAWLPTQFDFRMEVKPHRKSDVVFSPDAMKNFVRVVSKDTLESLPGIAHWMAFGWPSRFFGGFDIHYAGVQLFSRDGSIMLETLDPPEILKKERKHFILYGPRFQMPIQSSRYPVLMDTSGMSRLVQQMLKQVEAIASEEEKKEKRDDLQQDCTIPGFRPASAS